MKVESLSRAPSSSKVMMVDLDALGHQEAKKPYLDGEFEVVQIGSKAE